jgi:hypothetical protein
MLTGLRSRLRKTPALPPETPVTLRGYRGGAVRGAIVYAADDFAVAERYSTEVSELEYLARRPLYVTTAQEAQEIQEQAFADNRFLGGHTGHDHLGEWARAQGYDALVLTAAAREGLAVDGFAEMFFLEPERAREVDRYVIRPGTTQRPQLLPLPEPPAPVAAGETRTPDFDELL